MQAASFVTVRLVEALVEDEVEEEEGVEQDNKVGFVCVSNGNRLANAGLAALANMLILDPVVAVVVVTMQKECKYKDQVRIRSGSLNIFPKFLRIGLALNSNTHPPCGNVVGRKKIHLTNRRDRQ